VRAAPAEARPYPVERLRGVRQRFRFHIRHFDAQQEEKAVLQYCRKRAGINAEGYVAVFRKQHQLLAPLQGQERTTWLQVLQIGNLALAGVPGEFFTKLGLAIKHRSPFRYTYIAELANDWIGYLPDRQAFELGGYQTWTGLHSYAEPGTGERIVEEITRMLTALHQQ
jgi:hypothetical protein